MPWKDRGRKTRPLNWGKTASYVLPYRESRYLEKSDAATLFNNLDAATIGDTFTLAVFDEVFTYEVRETKVILPDETEEIFADPDRDLVTLITCTPLGINSHRILVTAERVTPTPLSDLEAATAPSELPGFPWWAVMLGGTIVTVGVCAWWAELPPSVSRKQPVR